MRKLLWTAIAVAVIGLIIAGGLAFSLNGLIAKNRERMLAQAGSALGRPITADRIAMNVWGGIGARVDNVRVADDPHFSELDFLRATAAVARVKFFPLLRGRLAIDRITLKEPRVHLIRDASGRWNYETIRSTAAAPAGSAVGPSSPSAAGSQLRLPFVLGAADLEDGSITVTDQTHDPARTMTLGHITVALRDVTETTPISFDLRAALQEESPNVNLHGIIGPLTDPSAIPLRLAGSLGPFGPQKVRLETFELDALIAATNVQVTHFSGRAFDGSFQLAGQLPLRANEKLVLQGDLTQMAIPSVLRLFSEEAGARVDGYGTVQLALHATGTSAETIRSTLAGQLAADLHDARIEDFNLVREVLGRVSQLPMLGDLVSQSVKPKYDRIAAAPDTRFRTLRATFHVADQTVRTNDLTIEADDFSVRASGSVTFSQEADLVGVLAMSPAFSRQVVHDLKEARYLLDNQEQLAVPFRLRGRLGVAKPQPDTDELVARLSRTVTSDEVKKLITGFLGAGPQPGATPHAEQPGSAIEQGLRRLFGR